MAVGDGERRAQIIQAVINEAEARGGILTSTELAGISVAGEPHRVVDRAKGIWNPRYLDATLSVVSSPDGPYNDREVEGGFIHYEYEAGGTAGNNTKLRRAFELQLPIIFLKKIGKGAYIPFAPVYVVGDDPEKREFLLSLEETPMSADLLRPDALLERRYAERSVLQRLHQREFRARVLQAYERRCAICLLKHAPLLDAAHITQDGAEHGVPVVSNGLSLCKIHHAAYDQNFIGIAPSYKVHVDSTLLEEVDGPMLKHGLQEMHGRFLVVPSRPAERPDEERLAERFVRFLARAG